MRRLLFLVLLAGCGGNPTEPEPPVFWVPPNASGWAPPNIVLDWYDDVLDDLGMVPHPPRIPIQWFTVPGVAFFLDEDGAQIRGLRAPDNRVYLLHPMRLREGLVKHETLHVILDGDALHAHPLFAIYDAIPWNP